MHPQKHDRLRMIGIANTGNRPAAISRYNGCSGINQLGISKEILNIIFTIYQAFIFLGLILGNSTVFTTFTAENA